LGRNNLWVTMEDHPLLGEKGPAKSAFAKALKIGAVAFAVAAATALTLNKRELVSETSLDTTITPTTQAHVVFMLVDDMGINDIGYNSIDLNKLTPNLDALANAGIKLEKYYSMQLCTPARSAFLTAKLPIKLGMQYENIHPNMPWGLPADEKIAAQYFRKGGYKAYIVGKWNQGHHKEEYLPTSRGFDSFTGYLSDEINYYTHAYPQEYSGSVYFDFCEGTEANGLSPLSLDGTYSTVIYTEAIKKLIADHDTSTGKYADHPMFLYYAAQNVHGPLDAPPLSALEPDALAELGKLSYTDEEHRLVFAAIVSAFDASVAELQTAMEEANIWDNTLLILASDNGGCSEEGGSNAPLRGGKHWLFEGGVNVPAFIYSASTAMMPSSVAGTSYTELFHVTDWLPTIMSAIDMPQAGRPTGANDIDGYDHWSMLMSEETSSIREDVLLHMSSWTSCCVGHEGDTTCSGFLSDCADSSTAVLTFLANPRGAIVSSTGYKMIFNEYDIPWYGIPTGSSTDVRQDLVSAPPPDVAAPPPTEGDKDTVDAADDNSEKTDDAIANTTPDVGSLTHY